MLPLPSRHIFRSRWRALIWAGAVCLGAIEIAGTAHGPKRDEKPQPGAKAPADNGDAATVAAALKAMNPS